VGRIAARQYFAGAEVQEILGKIEVEPPDPPDPSKITTVPVPLSRALLVGGPALLWIVVWRVIRLLLSAVGLALIIILVALACLLNHHWR
jgi:hypothetical protein